MNSAQFHYEITAKIEEQKVVDCNFCCFLRSPVYSMAGIAILKIFLPQITVKSFMERVSLNDFPEIKLNIRIVDEISQFHDKEWKTIFNQTLLCINVEPQGPLNFNENHIHVTLVLVHPILYYMGTTNTYNTIENNITAYQALKNYEGWLTENYGDVFDFKHFGATENKNNFQYEQMLLKMSNDANIPSYLIDIYKPTNNFTFYYFDNFSFDGKTKNEIVGYYINILKLKDQKSQKINLFPDMDRLTKIVKEIPFTDISKKYNKDGHVPVFVTSNMRYAHKVVPQSKIPKKKSSVKDVQLTDGRKIGVSKDGGISSNSINQSTTYSRIYVPDSPDDAQKRYDTNKEIAKEHIKRFIITETTNSLPDYPSFGNKYDIEKSGKYDYTPIAISNIFMRKADKEHFAQLINRTTFIQFKT
jgi:hypothetical protein